MVFMGELSAADEVIGIDPYFVGESNAQTEAMAGVARMWAVLAAEEQGTPITTETHAWREEEGGASRITVGNRRGRGRRPPQPSGAASTLRAASCGTPERSARC
ncbi:hypothetical protein N9L68_05790 [bacterium]|nr:hypothetical protein [bacterium]